MKYQCRYTKTVLETVLNIDRVLSYLYFVCQFMKIVLKFLSKGVLYDIHKVIKAKRGVKKKYKIYISFTILNFYRILKDLSQFNCQTPFTKISKRPKPT